jgi:DNA-binding MarR family transcriptional regulator
MSYFEDCMYFSANQLARHLNTIAEEAFKDLALTPTQGFALIAVGELGKHTPSEIAAELEMKPSTITRFLDKLEKLEFVERTYQGRQAHIEITPAGTDELKKIYESWRKIDLKIQEVYGKETAEALTKGIIKANQLYKNK